MELKSEVDKTRELFDQACRSLDRELATGHYEEAITIARTLSCLSATLYNLLSDPNAEQGWREST